MVRDTGIYDTIIEAAEENQIETLDAPEIGASAIPNPGGAVDSETSSSYEMQALRLKK